MNSDDRFDILNEITEWKSEIIRLENSDQDETEQILEIEKRINELNAALK